MGHKIYATNFLNPVRDKPMPSKDNWVNEIRYKSYQKEKKNYMLRMKYKSLSPTGSWQDLQRLIANAHTCPGTFSTPAGKRVPHWPSCKYSWSEQEFYGLWMTMWMDHCQRLFPKQEGIESAAPRILRRLNWALVPVLCVTIDGGVLPAFSAIISEKKNVKLVTLISQFRNGSDNWPRIYKLKIRSGFSEVTVFWGHGALNINH